MIKQLSSNLRHKINTSICTNPQMLIYILDIDITKLLKLFISFYFSKKELEKLKIDFA